MVTNIVLETNGSRPRLLEQTLRTLETNTPYDQYTLTLVADGLIDIRSTIAFMPNNTTLTIEPPCHVTGRLKNLGAYWSEKQFGRGEWLLFIDDDILVLPGWLEKMQAAFEFDSRIAIVGGCRHPYHGVNKQMAFTEESGACFECTDAVAGYCLMMKWATWRTFGEFDAHAKGIGQSEDFAICRKVVEKGRLVGYVNPPVVSHCGITNSNGQPATGSELFSRITGGLYE